MSDDLSEHELLRESVRLFNEAEYLEAHETLEELWEAGFGESADFYKGLLQASIALHHFRRGNLDGARKLYSGHRKLLGAYMPTHNGIDVSGFLGEMQRALSAMMRAREDPPAFDIEQRPRLLRT